MSVNESDINKIAKLAKLSIPDEEKPNITRQVNSIVSWVEQLSQVNTDNIDIVTNVHDIAMPMMQDIVSDGDIAKDILKNAPKSQYDYFATPKVIDSE